VIDLNTNDSICVRYQCNDTEVGMDAFLQDTNALGSMLVNAFGQDKFGDNDHVSNTILDSSRDVSSTPLYANGTKSNQIGTTMLLCNLNAMHDILDICFSTLLRYLSI
jgi:hypothetical protein